MEWFWYLSNVLNILALMSSLFQIPFATAYVLTGSPSMGGIICRIYVQLGTAAGIPNNDTLFLLTTWIICAGMVALPWVNTEPVQVLVDLIMMVYLGCAMFSAFVKIIAMKTPFSCNPEHNSYPFDSIVLINFILRLVFADIFGVSAAGQIVVATFSVYMLIMVVVLCMIVNSRKDTLVNYFKLERQVVDFFDECMKNSQPVELVNNNPAGFTPDAQLLENAKHEGYRVKFARLPLVLMVLLSKWAAVLLVIVDLSMLTPFAVLLGVSLLFLYIAYVTRMSTTRNAWAA